LKISRYKQDIDFQGVSFDHINESSTALLMGVIRVF